jgi:branched-chain amino acid transport system substrate-binding protein
MNFKQGFVLAICSPLIASAQGLPPISDMMNPKGPIVVRIGNAGPMSGAISHLGLDIQNGVNLAIQDLNAAKLTIQNRQVRWESISVDDGGGPEGAIEAAHKLVDAKVHAVIGHLNSGASIPAAAIYNSAFIPQLTPASSNPKFTRMGYSFVFRMVADDIQLGELLGKVVVERFKAKKILLVDDRTFYGMETATAFDNGVKASNGSITSRAFAPAENRDFKKIALQAATMKSDLIFYSGMAEDVALLLIELKNIGVDPIILGPDGICANDLPSLAQGAIKNDRVVCAEHAGIHPNEKDLYVKFSNNFYNQFGVSPNVYSPSAYDAVMSIANSMKLANSINPTEYVGMLQKTIYKGITGPIIFKQGGNKINPTITIMSYRDGKKITAGVIR